MVDCQNDMHGPSFTWRTLRVSLKGNISGAKNLAALSNDEKEWLKTDLEETFAVGDRQLIKARVNNDGITGDVSGPYLGIRAAGLSVGIVF